MIRAARGEALFVRADVSDAADVERMLNRSIGAYGRLDCAFNNAGIGALVPLVEQTEQDFDRVIKVNLKGVWLCMKYEIRQMLRQQGGAIVNASSVGGLIGVQGMSTYAASKHGVIGLTKSASLEYAQAGIRINAVCPGWIRTPMVEKVLSADPQFEAQILKREPVGRMGNPEEVAEAVVWLCSDAASFVTGHAMAVDGGLVAQ